MNAIDLVYVASEFGAIIKDGKFSKSGKYICHVQAGYIDENIRFNNKKKIQQFAEWCKGSDDFSMASVTDKFGCRI